MDINQLIRFQAAARCQNLTKAASELYMTQSTLSKSIQQLESELGIQLFNRGGKTLTLNRAGEVVLKFAEQMIDLSEMMKRALEDLNAVEPHPIKLATVRPLIAHHLFPQIVVQHPEIQLSTKLVKLTKSEAVNMLNLGVFDILFSNYPVDGENIISLLHSEEKMYLSVPESSPLASSNTIKKEDFADLTIPATQYSYDTMLKPLSDELKEQGISFNIIMTDDVATVNYLQRIADIPSVTTDVAWSLNRLPNRTIIEIEGVPLRKNYVNFLNNCSYRVQFVVKLLMKEYRDFSNCHGSNSSY